MRNVRKYRLDEPGAQLEIIERPDGVIELLPTLPVPVDEMWRRWRTTRGARTTLTGNS